MSFNDDGISVNYKFYKRTRYKRVYSLRNEKSLIPVCDKATKLILSETNLGTLLSYILDPIIT